MNRKLGTTTLAAATGLALAGTIATARARRMDPKAKTMKRLTRTHLE